MREIRKFVFLCAILIVLILVPCFASAQDQNKEGYKLDFLTVSSGEDPISSGITGILQFTNEHNRRLLEVGLQQEQAWLIYGRQFSIGKKIDGVAAGSVGHLQGAPWAGPILKMNAQIGEIIGQEVKLSTLQWPGIFLWEPRDWKDDGEPNPESVLSGYLGSVRLDVGPLGFVYSLQNFMDDPWNELPGVSYTFKVRKDVIVSGSATWNNNAERWMFYIGATWKPRRDRR